MNRPVDINYSLFSSGNAYVDFLDVEQVEEMAQAHRRARQPPASSGQTRFGLTPPLYYNLADGIAANRRINDALRQAANASGDVWFGVVEPKFGEAAVSEIHRIAGLGAAGVVWSPRAQGLFASDRSMSAMCRAAADSGLLSMIHSAPFSVNESLDRIWNLATACEGAAIVVIGLPMYNFGIPSALKAWIDHIARAGETFKYTATGPVGLLADRPVVLFATRGGVYQGTPRDTQSAYMTDLLNFVGLRNIEFVYAEGLAMNEETRKQSLDVATRFINRIAA